jgi:hypothetical protein
MKTLVISLILNVCHTILKAQVGEANKDKVYRLFFEGSWKGDGQIANGKKISATASFKLSLDSCWLIYSHEDKSPNRYKAISLGSVDSSKQTFAADIFDNFHGHKTYTGSRPIGDEIILTAVDSSKIHKLFQRFVYVKLDEGSFKMSYEVSNDNLNWTVGESLIFFRVQ